MAIITITDSENVIVEGSATAQIQISVATASVNNVEVRIDGFVVDQRGVPSAVIATGNIIRGVMNGRYIIAEVLALPYTNENNLNLFIQTIQ